MINNHKGLFTYTWLCFGIATSPGVFQWIIVQLIQGISKTIAYLDHILISGQIMEEHNSNLREVLKRLQDAGIHFRSDKCEFKNSSISYLGWKKFMQKGSIQLKRISMQFAKHPLQRMCRNCVVFSTFVNDYRRYLKNISTVLTPLYKLLQKGIPWKCGPSETFTFEQSKRLVMSTNVVVYYNAERQVIMMHLLLVWVQSITCNDKAPQVVHWLAG